MTEVEQALGLIAQSLGAIESGISDIAECLSEIRDAMCEKNGGSGIYVRADAGVTVMD